MNSDETENKQEQEAATEGSPAASTPDVIAPGDGAAREAAAPTAETIAEPESVPTSESANADDDALEEPFTEEALAGLISEVADAESTGSLSGGGNASKITTPLPEAGGPPRPPLAEGSTINERYEVDSFIMSSGETNIYRVADLQGYMRCWACGAISSMPGDIYCVECGAQLAGRHYRLQEFRLPMADDGQSKDSTTEVSGEVGFLPQLRVAPAILENRVQGVAHAYDAWYDLELGRGYV